MTSHSENLPLPARVQIDPSFEHIADAVCARLAKNQRVRRNLPGAGRVRFDRQLPFLCLYRQPVNRVDEGTRELVTTSAAYVFASGDPQFHHGLSNLCQRVILAMQEHFGTFLLLEIWAQEEHADSSPSAMLADPGFELFVPDAEWVPTTVEAFAVALQSVKLNGQTAMVTTSRSSQVAPPGLPMVVPFESESFPKGCCVLGVAVNPIYRDGASGHVFPILLQRLRWQFANVLRQGIAKFTGLGSGEKPVHYDSLGPSSLVKAVRMVDQELCEIASSFDFLLQVTPTNSSQAWQEFLESGYQTSPLLHYRPLPYDPSLLKRRLFNIEIERLEDPTMGHLCWEKQVELDRQLSALRDLETPEFFANSTQLYGQADDDLTDLARGLLARPVAASDRQDAGGITSADFVARAREEIDAYHQRLSAFRGTIEICDHIASGVMVSHDRLLVDKALSLRPDRVEPLIQHEIGTHLLTYCNGRCQPFRQLATGLAGYEELQEGLAVLAEYLSGGLTPNRIRTLAARVMAVRFMMERLPFPLTFSRLHHDYGIPPRQAFVTTLRAYRAGGLTKDVIYLRGLRDLHAHLASGHDIEPLYVGKVGLHHFPYLQEMRRRGIIHAPSLLPRFWDHEPVRKRLEECRQMSFLQLLESCL